jgi:CDP-paratose 2-epimerase
MQNSISIIEAFQRIEALTRKKMKFEYVEKNREGDHICYVSDLSKMRRDYPGWNITKSLDDIFVEIWQAMSDRTDIVEDSVGLRHAGCRRGR